ncbi:hypothetical protein CMI37_26980 [Candidatus Pacearchaeota archaeon]|nr:hypothetical protein [Candidatus Pacearchaeota archaeon]|tara:strand:+ start:24644 stop:25525 length:882 start_codon:yes stop_codon:yes gene_type:complete
MRVTAPVRIDVSGGWPDSDPYREEFGGCVFNAALALRVAAYLDDSGNFIISPQKVPPNSSLGASAAFRACCLALSNPKLLEDEKDLVRRVWLYENRVLKQRAGLQDEAAAIYGGVNLWKFGSGEVPSTYDPEATAKLIQNTPIPRDRAQHLEERLILINTNENHLSSNIHTEVFGPDVYQKNIPYIQKMSRIAPQMAKNITDEQTMGKLINRTWDLQKSLHSTIETNTMRHLQKAMAGSCLGWRALGAAGGGCVMCYGNKEQMIAQYQKIQQDFPNTQLIPVEFDYKGIKMAA